MSLNTSMMITMMMMMMLSPLWSNWNVTTVTK